MKKRIISFLLTFALCLGLCTPNMAFATQENGIGETVKLINGRAEKWIDRLDLSGEAQVFRNLYDTLVEASDNDGIDDYLIEDQYFNGNNKIIIAKITETTTGATQDEAIAQAQNRAQIIGSNYSAYAQAVFDAFGRDHPEVFWLSGQTQTAYSMGYSITQTGNNVTCTYMLTIQIVLNNVRATDYQSEAVIKNAIEKLNTNITSVLSTVNGFNTIEKIKYFNEYLTKNNEYNTSKDLHNIAHNCRECIGAIIGSTGTNGPVCEGYAKAFKVLCDRAGIPCVLVDGTANGEAHMWNYVQVDNAWYGVDVTWNDPIVQGVNGAISKYESEDWLLVGSDTVIYGTTFATSHVLENIASDGRVAFTNGPILSKTEYLKEESCTHTDENIDGKCDSCSVYIDGIGALAGYSLTLEGNIGVNFHMELESNVIHNENAYMQFTLGGKEYKKVKISDATTKKIGENSYYVFPCDVPAKDMLTEITAQIILDENTKGSIYSYSVKDYALYVINNSDNYSKEMLELVTDMISYGMAARDYFGGALVGVDEEMDSITPSMLEAYKGTVSGNSKGIYKGSSLLLESNTIVRHYFTQQVEGSTKKDNLYYIQFENIPAHKLNQYTKLEVDGITITYSPLSYAYAVLSSESNSEVDENLKNLVKAMYLYYDAANKYYNANCNEG